MIQDFFLILAQKAQQRAMIQDLGFKACACLQATNQPTNQPANQPTNQPASQSASQPVSQSVSQSVRP